MKSKLISVLTLATGLIAAAPAQAQSTNTTQVTPSSFFTSVESYFTAQNTNAAEAVQFDSVRGAIWTGAEYQSGVNIDSVLGIEYQPFTNLNLSIGSVTRNAAIAGTIDAEQIDLGWNINKADTQLTLGVGGGYDFHNSEGVVAVYGEVKKALTAHTYAGLRLEEDLNFRGGTPPVPIVGVFAGFTF